MAQSLVMAKGLALLNEAMSHAMQGHPRWMGHTEEFWQNVVYRRRKWQPTLVFLPGELHGQYEKAQKDEPPKLEGAQYATGEEQRAITNSFSKNMLPW